MAADKSGGIWVGGQAGLYYFKDGKFSLPDALKKVSKAWVRSIAISPDGSLWIATRSNGIICYTADKKLELYREKEGLPDNSINKIAVAPDGRLYFIAGVKILGFIENKKIKVFKYFPQNLASIFVDSKNRLWAGTNNNGVFVFSGKTLSHLTVKEGLPENSIITFGEESSGGIWSSSLGGGLVRYVEGKISSVKNFLKLDAPAQFFMEDSEKNLWIAFFSRGIASLKDGKVTVFSEDQGMKGANVSVMFESKKGGIWVGTVGGALNYLYNGHISQLYFPEIPETAFYYSIFEDSSEGLWLAIYGKGLGYYKNNVFKLYTPKDHPALGVILCVYEDSQKNIWVGTWQGLLLFKDGVFKSFTKKDGIDDKFIRGIIEAKNKDIWIVAQEKGIYRYRDGKFTNFNTTHGLPGTNMQSLTETSDGAIWFTTYGFGVSRYKDGVFKSISEDSGLNSNLTYDVLEDNGGNIWITSNKGVSRFAKKEVDLYFKGKLTWLTSQFFGIGEGMLTEDMNGGTQFNAIKTKDGKLWFSTVNGLVMIDPLKMKLNNLIPPVKIESFIAGEKVFENQKDRTKITIPAGVDRFEFHYTTLSFTNPSKVRHKYQLLGFDQSWINAGERREAYYTNLAPGNYKFVVIGSNNDGIWNSEGEAIEFYLEPRFYQTIWFKSLLSAVVFFGVIFFFYYKIRAVRRKERQLLHQDRLSSLGILVSGMAHEIHNPNNYIMLNAKLMSRIWNDSEEIIDEFVEENGDVILAGLSYTESKKEIENLIKGIAQGSDRIKNIVDNLKNFAKKDNGRIDQAVDLNSVVDSAITILKVSIQKSTERFVVEKGKKIPLLCGNFQQLEQVVINLLTNACDALTAKNQEISIKTSYSSISDEFTIVVKDEGIGIKPREMKHLMDPFFTTKRDSGGTGLGLAVSYSIIKNHGGTISFESEPNKGTKVFVRIKNRSIPIEKIN